MHSYVICTLEIFSYNSIRDCVCLQHFHEVAYTALMADDLLDAINVFLDDSIVLPPGDWDENLLLPVMHQRNEMRKRKGWTVYLSLPLSPSSPPSLCLSLLPFLTLSLSLPLSPSTPSSLCLSFSSSLSCTRGTR